MTTVITYGTFDLFHYGHYMLLKRASLLGDRLVVFLSTDEFNKIKGKKSFLNYKERYDILNDLNFVNLILPESSWEQKERDIELFDDDTIFVMGSDWKGKFDYLNCKVVYLDRTEGISSTKIKELINYTS